MHSGVPSSKIYAIMKKFELLGLVEVQQSKPARFKALEPSQGVDRLVKSREKEVISLRDTLPLLQSELDSIFFTGDIMEENQPFFNLQFGMKNHIQKHLIHLANAKTEIFSYFETVCLQGARIYGHTIKQDIVRNIMANRISSKVLFGAEDKKLIDSFVKGLPESADIELRTTKQIHAPFHVIDKKSAIVVVDNPLFRDGRIASLHVIDSNLAKELHDGFRTLWESSKSI
jgi:sugar-specific transcriptional regulator TrmB